MKVYISQLPPRKTKNQEKVREVNLMLKNNIPENVKLIEQTNLTDENMIDDKHIKRTDIALYAANIKRAMREGYTHDPYQNSLHNQNEHRNNKTTLKRNSLVDDETFRKKLFSLLETNNNTMTQMKDMFK